MGFVLSILYFVTYYLTPTTIFGPLAAYRIELILAVLVILASIPALMNTFIWKTPQLLGLIGLMIAVILSVLIGMHWPGGSLQAFLGFIPNAFAYFLVCLHCNSKKRFQFLILMLLFVCAFALAQGFIERLGSPPDGSSSEWVNNESAQFSYWQMTHPYLLATSSPIHGSAVGKLVYRQRGLGEINDPNDFAQLIVCVIPLVFIFWRSKRTLRNFAFVILPVGFLLYGIFLTHSRGALIAVLAVTIMAARRRIGTMPALLIAGVLFVGAMALNFTGGRDISADAGADRTALWGAGLQVLKSNPFFGVGFNGMGDYTDTHQTAHNSVVVCAAELGLFGLFFWSLFLFPTGRDALTLASPAKVNEPQPDILEDRGPLRGIFLSEVVDKVEINHFGRLLMLSLTGFLMAGWFLSRSFVMTLFLLGGLVEAVYERALRRGMVAPRLRLERALPYAGGLAFLLVLVMYIMLRILNLMR